LFHDVFLYWPGLGHEQGNKNETTAPQDPALFLKIQLEKTAVRQALTICSTHVLLHSDGGPLRSCHARYWSVTLLSRPILVRTGPLRSCHARYWSVTLLSRPILVRYAPVTPDTGPLLLVLLQSRVQVPGSKLGPRIRYWSVAARVAAK